MIRVFIGFDSHESVAYHVLQHSIMRNSTAPISITPLFLKNFSRWYDRPRGEFDSTEFAITRFLVPLLCDFQGYAVFMDCDMLCRGDIGELANFMTLTTRWTRAVHVVKHKYQPSQQTKFLDQPQTVYSRKNWSSVMLFNNSACRALTREYVTNAPGLDLHQFKWCADDMIGEIPKTWNYLVGEPEQCAPSEARLIHYTNGTPCFPEYANCEFSDEWRAELAMVNHCG